MQEELDLDKIKLTLQTIASTNYKIIDDDVELNTWPNLLVQFAYVLKDAGYDVPIDLVDKYLYKGVMKEYNHRQEVKKLEGQLDLPLE